MNKKNQKVSMFDVGKALNIVMKNMPDIVKLVNGVVNEYKKQTQPKETTRKKATTKRKTTKKRNEKRSRKKA